MGLAQLKNRVRRALHDPKLPVWYALEYRLPITGLEHMRGIEPRRADLAAWSLLAQGAIQREQLRVPPRVRYGDLLRVHEADYLESLTRPEPLAQIFAADTWDVPVDEVLHSIRLATGGTVAATRAALARRGPALNLLGGFHHAYPDKGGGMCPVNDLAVALGALRAEGFDGQAVVIDLDAHPPDGTAACLVDDPLAWIGSISGSDWGPLDGDVDETVLPGADDHTYLAALDELLGRMPRPALAFVIAGGDVLAGDKLGALSLTLAGARQRDLAVARCLSGLPSVWVPGGGYTNQAWRLLTGTGLVLALGSTEPISERADPLSERFADVARRMDPKRLMGEEADEPWITEADLADVLGLPGRRPPRLLDYYTAEGIEYGLFRYGLLDHVRRLGYGNLRVEIARVAIGDRMRVYGTCDGQEHLLTEGVFAREVVEPPSGVGEPATVLFVHWLTLRHPRGSFSDARPRLPGQEEPGQGTAREAGQVMAMMATRLGLDGVAHRPSWYHVAYASRYHFRFVDPRRQGRFEALLRDLASLSLLEATHAVAEGRVLLDGEPYGWEPDLMVAWLADPPWREDPVAVDAERHRARFVVVEEPSTSPPPPPEAPA